VFAIADRAFVLFPDAHILTVALATQRCLGRVPLPFTHSDSNSLSLSPWTVLTASLDPLSVSTNSPSLLVLLSRSTSSHHQPEKEREEEREQGTRLLRVNLKEIATQCSQIANGSIGAGKA
jgi:hypothetical protein